MLTAGKHLGSLTQAFTKHRDSSCKFVGITPLPRQCNQNDTDFASLHGTDPAHVQGKWKLVQNLHT